MPNFIKGLPAQKSALQSSEIRNNFIALDARTGKIVLRATNPASTAVTTDSGIVYSTDRIPFSVDAQQINLGDATTGVAEFSNLGYYRDIVIVIRFSFDQETLTYNAFSTFVEGPEKASSTSEPDLVALRSTDLPIARLIVRHNGISLGQKGEIDPVTQSDIVDYRNYLDVGGITYYSASVGDREVDGYLNITGETIGTFTGTVDNVSPIQQAIDSLTETGGTVFLKRGTYTISSTLTLPANVQLVGEGRMTSLEMTDFVGPLLSITGDSAKVENIKFLGSATHANVSNPLIVVSSASYVSIKDCFLEECSHGGIRYTTSTKNICIGNYFLDNDTYGLNLQATSAKNIINSNQFYHSDPMFSSHIIDDDGDNQTIGNSYDPI